MEDFFLKQMCSGLIKSRSGYLTNGAGREYDAFSGKG